MNQFIAWVFEKVNAFIHVVVIIALILLLLGYLLGFNSVRQFFLQFGIADSQIILAIFGAFLLYALFAGFISTIISMNRYLRKLSENNENP